MTGTGAAWRGGGSMAVFVLALITLCGVDSALAQTSLINGGLRVGTIPAGNTNSFSLPAQTGDAILLRLGTTNFTGWVGLYGPGGGLLATAQGTDVPLTWAATNTGVLTVAVSGLSPGESGTYGLRLVQFPEAPAAPAPPLVNGGANESILQRAGLDRWSVTANAGDSLMLRCSTTNFWASASLYGPTGALLDSGWGMDVPLSCQATNGGTFTVVVSSWSSEGSGAYRVRLVHLPGTLAVPGVALTNGVINPGVLAVGDMDIWTLPARAGDHIDLRLGSTNFIANLSIFGPTGVLLGAAQGSDAYIPFTATNSGVFTVLVSLYWHLEGMDDYVLHLARIPGDFMLPPGKQGGPLSEGYNAGTLALADLARWTMSAQAGDTIILRLGAEEGFQCNLDVFGPQGNPVSTWGRGTDIYQEISVTNSGAYTVMVSSYFGHGGTGQYALYLAHLPSPFTVSPGHSGGSLAGRVDYQGAFGPGEMDRWQFTACAGDPYVLTLTPTNFYALIGLYGPDGTFLANGQSTNTMTLAGTATNCGTFTVLVSSYIPGGAGAYHLRANGLSDGLKVCPPLVAGNGLTVQGAGGTPNAPVILYAAPRATTPAASWIPVFTNTFDRTGVFGYTNVFDPGVSQEYFWFRTP